MTDQKYLERNSCPSRLKAGALNSLEDEVFLMSIVCSKASHYPGAHRKPDVPSGLLFGQKDHEAPICLLTNV